MFRASRMPLAPHLCSETSSSDVQQRHCPGPGLVDEHGLGAKDCMLACGLQLFLPSHRRPNEPILSEIFLSGPTYSNLLVRLKFSTGQEITRQHHHDPMPAYICSVPKATNLGARKVFWAPSQHARSSPAPIPFYTSWRSLTRPSRSLGLAEKNSFSDTRRTAGAQPDMPRACFSWPTILGHCLHSIPYACSQSYSSSRFSLLSAKTPRTWGLWTGGFARGQPRTNSAVILLGMIER